MCPFPTGFPGSGGQSPNLAGKAHGIWTQIPFRPHPLQNPLSTVTLNYFQSPSLATLCPTARPLLKSINPYNWPVLSTCPNPQPMKICPFLRTHLKCRLLQEAFSDPLPKGVHHSLSYSSSGKLNSIRSYYNGLPVLLLSMAGVNPVLKCRSVHEIAHFLNRDRSLPVHLRSSSPAGMLQVLRSHVILQAWQRALGR